MVYTCVTGRYDRMRAVPTECKCMVFADVLPKSEKGAGAQWKWVRMGLEGRDPRMASRRPKFVPHDYFSSDFSVWTDGHVRWKKDPVELLSYLGDADVAMFSHPIRRCAYREADEVVRIWPEIGDRVGRQMSRYRKDGFPENAGLMACGVIVRRHTEATRDLGEAWWMEWERWRTSRDQLSFAYVCWKAGVRVSVIPGNILRNDFEVVERHVRRRNV